MRTFYKHMFVIIISCEMVLLIEVILKKTCIDTRMAFIPHSHYRRYTLLLEVLLARWDYLPGTQFVTVSYLSMTVLLTLITDYRDAQSKMFKYCKIYVACSKNWMVGHSLSPLDGSLKDRDILLNGYYCSLYHLSVKGGLRYNPNDNMNNNLTFKLHMFLNQLSQLVKNENYLACNYVLIFCLC